MSLWFNTKYSSSRPGASDGETRYLFTIKDTLFTLYRYEDTGLCWLYGIVHV